MIHKNVSYFNFFYHGQQILIVQTLHLKPPCESFSASKFGTEKQMLSTKRANQGGNDNHNMKLFAGLDEPPWLSHLCKLFA